MQLLSANPKVSLSKKMPTKSWKPYPQKLLRNTQNFFHPAKTAQKEEFRLQNVAYTPNVYRIVYVYRYL